VPAHSGTTCRRKSPASCSATIASIAAAAAEDAFEQEPGGIEFPDTCPEDLVTVTSVEDDTPRFDFEFGTQPLG
jgi:hypothetical protein